MLNLTIGRIPVVKGEYTEGSTYNKLWQVTYLGSTYQSKIDNNTTAPAEEVDGIVSHINTDKWLCIADATNAVNSQTELTNHKEDTNNPHKVTASQVGLGNVDNTSDADKPISTATQTALNAKANASSLGVATKRIDDLEDNKVDNDDSYKALRQISWMAGAPEWETGVTYKEGWRVRCNGWVFKALSDVTDTPPYEVISSETGLPIANENYQLLITEKINEENWAQIEEAYFLSNYDLTVQLKAAQQTIAQYETLISNLQSGKQDVINDLATIRSGAALGATAIQSHQDISGKADVTTVEALAARIKTLEDALDSVTLITAN